MSSSEGFNLASKWRLQLRLALLSFAFVWGEGKLNPAGLCCAQTLDAGNAYLAGLDTDATNTLNVARNFAAILGGPLTGSNTLTLRGGYASAASSIFSLINNNGNTFNGNLVVDVDGGTLKLAGNPYTVGPAQQGALLPGLTAANAIAIRRGATLLLDDNATASAAGYIADRLGAPGDRPTVLMEGGTFNLNGANYAVPMTQSVGQLVLVSGPSVINVTRAAGTPILLFDGLIRSNGTFVNFTGTALGSGVADGRIIFNTAPELVGEGGATGTTTMSILPGGRSGNDLVWHGTNGVRALLAAEYANVTGNDINLAGATENVRFTNAAPAAWPPLTAPRTVNALVLTSGNATWALSDTLTLTSGQLLSTPNNSRTFTNGTLTAGAGQDAELHITVLANTMTFGADAVIVDNGTGVVTLVKSGLGTLALANNNGDNTFSGGTYLLEGTLTTGATTNRLYLGKGPVTVDNATLTLNGIGATTNTSGADYTAVNGGYIAIANAPYTPDDTFNIGTGSMIYGLVGTNTGLNSLDRGIGGSVTNIVLSSDAIIGHPALTAPLDLTYRTVRNLGTNADLYYGLGAAQASALGSVPIGGGTPFKGISTLRTAVAWNLGTLAVGAGTDDIFLQGLGVPGVVPVLLTLGNTALTAGGPVISLTDSGTVNVNILGAVTFDDNAAVFGDTSAGKVVVLVVQPGATLTLNSPNALGSGAGVASASVRVGGTLALTGNSGALNGAVSIEPGGRLQANHAGGLTGAGTLTFAPGAIIEIITAANGFSGPQASAATIPPGVIVRLGVGNVGSPAAALDTFLADRFPIYEIYGGNNWPANPAVSGTTIMTLNRTSGGAGGILVNDLTSRTITAVPNGVIVIGTNSGVIAATAGTILTVPQAIALGTNELIIGYADAIDGTPPKLGIVSLSAVVGHSTAEPGSRITIIPGAMLNHTVDAIPDAADLVVHGTFTNGAADTIGSLAGTGRVDLAASALTVGRNNNSTTFAGIIAGSGAFTKTGAGQLDLTCASNTYTGAITVNGGILALSGGGALTNTGTAAFTLLGDGTFLLDNAATNNTNRLAGVAPGITFNGGKFRFIGRDGEAAGEMLGAASFAAGNAVIEVVNGTGPASSSEVVFSGVTPGTGTVQFTGVNGTLGMTGDNPRVIFAGLANGVVGYGMVGNAPAYHDTTNGIRAYAVGEGIEFDGTVNQTGTNTVYTTANNHLPMTAARSVNSLWVDSPGAGYAVDLGAGAFNLTIVSGRLLLTGSDDFEVRRSGTGTLLSGVNTRMYFGVADPAATLTISVPIATGTGAVDKDGPGTLVLNATNTFTTGGLVINAGTVTYGPAGDMTNNAALSTRDSGILDFAGMTDAIGAVTLYSGGITNSGAGGNLTIGSLTMGAGPAGSSANIDSGSGTVTITGNVTYAVGNDPNTAVIAGNLDLGGATRTFTVNNSVAAGATIDLDVPAAISGAASNGITKAGTGVMRLRGTNTFDGPLSVTGTLLLGHPQALGLPGIPRTFSVAAASSLIFDGAESAISVPANYTNLLLNGSGNTFLGPNSGVLVNQSGTNDIPGAITLAAASQFAALGGRLVLNGNISGAGLGLTIVGEGDIEINGVLGTTSGTLTKNGGGTLILGGADANTFSGVTTVNGGTLRLNKNAGANAIPGAGALNVYSGGRVQHGSSHVIGDAVPVNLHGSGQLDFNGADDTVGAVTINSGTGAALDTCPITNSAAGGILTIGPLAITPVSGHLTTIDTGSGTLALASNVTFNVNGTGRGRLAGLIDLGALSHTFSVTAAADVDGGIELDVPAVVGGAAGCGLVKTGTGALRLSNTNTFDGPVTISGTLRMNNPRALGIPSMARTNTVAATSSLVLDGVGIDDPDDRIILSLNGTGNPLLGPVAGALVNASGNNTVPCAITLAAAGTIASLAPGATLTLAGNVKAVNFGLTVAGNGNTLLTGILGLGTGTLVKNGGGRLTIASTNAYTGATTVNDGTLRVNGSILSSPSVTVTNPGILDGTGIVKAITVNSGGIVAPGVDGPGTLTAGGIVTLNAGAIYEWEIAPSNACDLIVTSSNLILNSTWTLRLKDGGGTASAAGRYTLFQYSGTMTFGAYAVDSSALDPAVWDTSAITIVHDPANKRVYLTGLRHKGPAVAISDTAVREGDAGTTTLDFTVYVVNGATNVTVDFNAIDGTAVAGLDYIATNGTLYIDGLTATAATVTVIVNGDTDNEWPAEHLYVALANAANARIDGAPAAGAIIDDDHAQRYWLRIDFPWQDLAEPLVDFPALVILSERLTNFSYGQFASDTGGDLRFLSADRSRPLNFEIERWNRSGDSYAWVQLPELTGSNTYIWACWGDPAMTDPPPCTTNGATWDAWYMGVWHLSATNGAGLYPDATANRCDATNSNCQPIEGAIAGGLDFYGINSLIPTGLASVDGNYTFEFLLNSGDSGTGKYILDIQSGRIILLWNSPVLNQAAYSDGTLRAGQGAGLDNCQWHHLSFAFDRTAAQGTIYTDGLPAGAPQAYTTRSIGGGIRFGCQYNAENSYSYDGLMDEMRISRVPRSAAWILASRMTQMANAQFTRYAAVSNTIDTLTILSRPASGVAAVNATLNGTLASAGGAENPAIYVCWGTTDGGTNDIGDWAHTESLGAAWGAGSHFSVTVTNLDPGTEYRYRCFATNSAGWDWSDTSEFFSTRYAWYVALDGSDAAGTNWATAFTNIQQALDRASNRCDEIYIKGGTYWVSAAISNLGWNGLVWSNSGVSLRGGYEGMGLPGLTNSSVWPTIIARPSSSTNRILLISGVTNGLLAGVVISNGQARYRGSLIYDSHPTASGGGLFVSNCRNLTVADCTFVRNLAFTPIANGGEIYGGGAYITGGSVTISNCLFYTNRVDTIYSANVQMGDGGGLCFVGGILTLCDSIIANNVLSGDYNNGTTKGGGLYLNGAVAVRNCVIRNNDAGNPYGPTKRGDGIYIGGGYVDMRNCIVAANKGPVAISAGCYLFNGQLWLENCTVVSNEQYGIYRSGGIGVVTNSILWANGDDLYESVAGNVKLYYSAIEDGDSLGANGCVTNNPEFADWIYFHEQSEFGHYSGGYFAGGDWTNAPLTSPLIDAGCPDIVPTGEPYPNGAIVNLGAYGNTPVASKSHPLAITNLAATAIGTNDATLNGLILHMGGPDVHVWFYYGLSDGGTNRFAWDTNVFVGVRIRPENFAMLVAGLQPDSNYFYTCFASNAAGDTAWAMPATNFVPTLSPAVIVNRGASNEMGPAVTLHGEVTATGGNTPQVYVCWGASEGDLITTASWAHVEDVGVQTGVFSHIITTEPGLDYFYTCFATNAGGAAWANPPLPFGANRIRYVAADATGLGTGYNWSNAYASLQVALDDYSPTQTNIIRIKGGIHSIPLQLVWTGANVQIHGGYEGVGVPGARDPANFPTILRNPGSLSRVLFVWGVTNGELTGVTIANGGVNDHGAGIFIGNCSNLLIADCIITNNASVDAVSYGLGGGIYASNSWGVIRSCRLERNSSQSSPAGYRNYGGGLYATGGAWQIEHTVFFYNRSRATGSGSLAYGGGLYLDSGNHILKNCLLVQNEARGPGDTVADSKGDGLYHAGGALLVDNCTFAGNIGEGIRSFGGTIVTNSILWQNRDDVTGAVALAYTLVGDGDNAGSNGCFSADPLFEYGFYLAPASPCTNAGAITAAEAGLDGRSTRTDGAADDEAIDLGYHYAGAKDPWHADLYVVPGNSDTNSGTNWSEAVGTLGAALGRAWPGSHIHIGAGTYTTNSGESFPIYLDISGVHLLGAGMTNTFLNAPGNPVQTRVMILQDASFCRLEGLTIANGYQNISGIAEIGSGLFIDNAYATAIIGCALTNNQIMGGNNTYARGAAIAAYDSDVEMADCFLLTNRIYLTGGLFNGYGYGAGLYIDSGRWLVRRSVFARNQNYVANLQGSVGGGIYVNNGSLALENSLVCQNNCFGTTPIADGLYIGLNAAGAARNCTIADNPGQGVYLPAGAPALAISNCIVWGNSADIVGTITPHYCCVEDGTGEGLNGTIRSDPLFEDRVYYHVQSLYGHYSGEYFTNGGWTVASLHSPTIDACNPWIVPVCELQPNGAIVNMGAYGDSPVAALSHPIEVTNAPASGISLDRATLAGELLHVGGQNVHLWIFWGDEDGTNNPAAWDTNNYIGVVSAPTSFTVTVYDLVPGRTYYYTAFASNGAAATAWAQPSTNFTTIVSPPEIANRGVSNEVGPLVTLYGEVTSTGGDAPQVYVCWGENIGAAGTGSWGNVVSAGPKTGAFEVVIATEPDKNYFYTCFATNSAGSGWAAPVLPFGPYAVMYVDAGAGGSGSGYTWPDAYQTLQAALNACSAAKTNFIYLKGGVYVLLGEVAWSASNVVIRGGYEGVGTPGACDPEQWPTILTKLPANDHRIMNIQGVCNGRLENLTVASGGVNAHGGGIAIADATNLAIQACIITNCVAFDAGIVTYGGGIYASNSWVAVRGCRIERNLTRGTVNGYRCFGGGIYAAGGVLDIADTIFLYNRCLATASGCLGFGGGLFLEGGAHVISNSLLAQNYARGVNDSATYSQGSGLFITNGVATLMNCTLAGNINEGIRGAGNVALTDSIVWRNGDDLVGVTNLDHCDISDGEGDGTNDCFAIDPRFEYGFYLAAGSPCIDTGSRSSAAAGLDTYTTDAGGAPDADTVDLGYHAAGAKDGRFADLYVGSGGNDAASGTNWVEAFASVTRALKSARIGTYIHLGAGIYTTNTGEAFPLLLDIPGLRLLGTNAANTIISATASFRRVSRIVDAAFVRLEGITFAHGTIPAYSEAAYAGGAGLYIDHATDLGIFRCVIVSNLNAGGVNEYRQGAGIYANVCSVFMADSVVLNNRAAVNAGPWAGYAYGAGLFVNGGAWMFTNAAVVGNEGYGNNYGGSIGAGIYITGGPHTFRNVLVANNNCTVRPFGGDGIYLDGYATFEHITVASNATIAPVYAGPREGIRLAGGAATIHNSIVWGNDDDLYGFPTNEFGIISNVTYTCIEDGDNLGVDGCVTNEPMFVDATHFHLQAQNGFYTNGYFSGGKVRYSLKSSPLIDLGDPLSEWLNEPAPHGSRVNLGAYGNTPVASRSHTRRGMFIILK